MNWESLYIMRHEVLLTIFILFQLVSDLSEGSKRTVVRSTIVAFGLFTIAGFLPSGDAVLFGGMYISDELRLLLKNILN